ncbi:hypothetical protein GLOTRDRAFT_47586 [Gloeophyllum trabeum ATCC 11539]|uniref:F-box domain-containing protein n=1 Tax=Gloeophyllum trabeum (strain ATCC 11539 / FP-39264 / Madison 617) TaxID=670483 RepID=S7PX13_GLOTA|nr:uncharacterized protein GLOTRDRAFT_47586 [Gloeophyllum trabeum ATCC 11539]EPQ52023.1 hypothetical protein GLOTRDRAFT_47586 [Gloeophyllum trabeum ATCC 11539]
MDLATWDDIHAVRAITDDEVDPNTIDPRPTPPEVVSIDERVAELEAELASLRIRRKEILASQALIDRVPPEVLARVFELGVHHHHHLLYTLSLVSRKWRRLALDTPALWSYVKLDYHWGYSRSAQFQAKMRLYLQRSAAAKLLVDLDCRYLDVAPELRAIMAELAPHLARCFSFRVSVPDWEWMGVVRAHCGELGPALEDLYLRVDPADTEDQTPCTLLRGACPRLRTIVLEHTPLAAIRADLPALRKLHLIRDQRYVSSSSSSRIGISFSELMSLLAGTPTLQTLLVQSATFLLSGAEPIFDAAPALTPIPALTTLSFHFLESTNLALFLSSTSLPALHTLQVQMDGAADETMTWLPLVTARLPSLRHLDLRACTLDGVHLAPLVRALHALPQVTALGLSSPPSGVLGTKLFDLLAAGPPWLLPRLEALALQACRDLSGHELLRVAGARAAAGRELRYLKLAQCYAVDPEVMDQVKRVVPVVYMC